MFAVNPEPLLREGQGSVLGSLLSGDQYVTLRVFLFKDRLLRFTNNYTVFLYTQTLPEKDLTFSRPE